MNAPDKTISESMAQAIEHASWIRQMFEEGSRLKAEVGADRVYDFTLGNPSVAPPPAFKEALVKAAQDSDPSDHRYMTNSGLLSTRNFVAEGLRDVHHEGLKAEHVVMTCGAAGGLNIFLKSVLNPGQEVVMFRPFFPEYLFYVENHGGKNVFAATDENFQPDIEDFKRQLSPQTRVVLINSPNNPTGVVYQVELVEAIAKIVEAHSEQIGHPIYLVMDEPYRRICYTDRPQASVLQLCRYAVLITSFSKELGLAGERIGYVALNPDMPQVSELANALSIATRILGFVNAPAFMQRVIPLCGHIGIDISEYRLHRDLLWDALREVGCQLAPPEGAFFMFPRVPGGDDVEFCRLLRERYLLCVPGRGFGSPGHIRISYAVPTDVVKNAIPIFQDVFRQQTRLINGQSAHES